MAEFEVGRVVVHPEHGACTITFVGKERIGVALPSGNHALFRKADFAPRTDTTPRAPVVADIEDARPDTWPENTFAREAPDARHFMGSQWDPFVDDATEIIKRLPGFVSEGQLLRGFGDFCKAPRPEPSDWAHGWHLAWPNHDSGIVITGRATAASNEIMSMYPFLAQGTEHALLLDRVVVWSSEVEAQVRGFWQEIPLSFFDTHYLINRGWYEAGDQFQFILRGIAYTAKPSDVFELPFTPDPDQVAWERMLAERRGETPREPPQHLNLRGMATLMPVAGWDIDDYSFRGPVKSVVVVDEILGQQAWRVRLTVLRDGDEDFDLDVFITQRAWSGDQPPVVGQDIEGQLWFQGHLWMAQRWADECQPANS